MAKRTTSAKNSAAAPSGRGKKQCPVCNGVVGGRSVICPTCGYDFKTPTKKKRVTEKRTGATKTDAKKAATAKAGSAKSTTGSLHAELKKKKADLQKQIEAIDTLLG